MWEGKQNGETENHARGYHELLDSCYEKCLNGIPMASLSVEEMANDYRQWIYKSN